MLSDEKNPNLPRQRRRLYRRALRQIRASLAEMTADQLMQAVEAETPRGTITCIISSAPFAGMEVGPRDRAAVGR
jgi:hypothetical protein